MSYLNSENGVEGLGDKHMGRVWRDQYTISWSGCEEQVIAQKVQRTLNKAPLFLMLCTCRLHNGLTTLFFSLCCASLKAVQKQQLELVRPLSPDGNTSLLLGHLRPTTNTEMDTCTTKKYHATICFCSVFISVNVLYCTIHASVAICIYVV